MAKGGYGLIKLHMTTAARDFSSTRLLRKPALSQDTFPGAKGESTVPAEMVFASFYALQPPLFSLLLLYE